MAETMRVQVCYALPDKQAMRDLTVPVGATLQQAIRQSGILSEFPEIDLDKNNVGIFGKLKSLDVPLRDGDRIEIYRPLSADAKEARRRRLTSRSK